MYLNHIRAFKVTKIFCTSFKLSKRIQEKIMALNNSYKTCSAFIDIVCYSTVDRGGLEVVELGLQGVLLLTLKAQFRMMRVEISCLKRAANPPRSACFFCVICLFFNLRRTAFWAGFHFLIPYPSLASSTHCPIFLRVFSYLD